MMPIEHVDAKSDARLGDYIDLTDVALRTSFEAEHGLYIAESAKVTAPTFKRQSCFRPSALALASTSRRQTAHSLSTKMRSRR